MSRGSPVQTARSAMPCWSGALCARKRDGICDCLLGATVQSRIPSLRGRDTQVLTLRRVKPGLQMNDQLLNTLLWVSVFILSLGIAYAIIFSEVTRALGSSLSEESAGRGYQDAVTPPWQTWFS